MAVGLSSQESCPGGTGGHAVIPSSTQQSLASLLCVAYFPDSEASTVGTRRHKSLTTGVGSVKELVLSGTWKVIPGREEGEDFEARTTLLRAQPTANLSEPWRAGAPSSLGGVVLVEVKSLDLKHGITLSRKVW